MTQSPSDAVLANAVDILAQMRQLFAMLGMFLLIAGLLTMLSRMGRKDSVLSPHSVMPVLGGLGLCSLGFALPNADPAAGSKQRTATHHPDPTHSATPSPTHTQTHSVVPDGVQSSPPWAWLLFVGAAVITAIVTIAIIAVLARRAREHRSAHLAERSTRQALASRWGDALTSLDVSIDRWLRYDKDLTALLEAPAMRDYSTPQTLRCADVMGAAEALRDTRPGPRAPLDQASQVVSDFEAAVRNFEATLTVAERFAKGAALRRMGRKERAVLNRAQDALRLAMHGATEGERQNAYKLVARLMRELDIEPHARAIEAVETQVRRQIGPADHDATKVVQHS